MPSRVAALLLVASVAFAQTAPVDPVVLAKYDANKNGRLDPEEVAAMETDQRADPRTAAAGPRDETVILSPFEVTSEGRGYYASSTMSGTRLNRRSRTSRPRSAS